MMTTRLMPPPSGPFVGYANGRTYTCAQGSTLDVPDWDARVLTSNGWVPAALVGVTAGRPTNPSKNQQFHDTTLGYTIVWDGRVWRNPATGASV